MANKVLGMHRIKNKVNRNAFDLSHRHMFTAQVGELLPVLSCRDIAFFVVPPKFFAVTPPCSFFPDVLFLGTFSFITLSTPLLIPSNAFIRPYGDIPVELNI